MVILGGTDGTILTYDMRTPKRSCLQSHIFPRGVICDFDVCGNTVVASSMRSQLNPFGQHQWTLDPNLRAADIRSARVGANIFFEPGAAKLRFHPAVPSSVIAASAEGELRVLDSSGAMTAPSTLTLGGVLERGAQLCALTISSTGQLLAAADSSGALDICGTASLPAEELQVNALSQPTESADLAEPVVPLSWESPVGGIPLFEEEEEVTPAALASDWPSKLLAKRGARTLEPEELLRSLPHPWIVSEDAHTNVQAVARHLFQFMKVGDYYVAEDTVDPEKRSVWFEWLEECGRVCALDLKYADFYGVNINSARNGWVRKVDPDSWAEPRPPKQRQQSSPRGLTAYTLRDEK